MKKNGFTVIESLVAIAILVSVIIGVTSAVQKGISSYIISKEQIVAFYLAQEGVEQIRSMRDNNGLEGVGWLDDIAEDLSDPCHPSRSCIVDAVTSDLEACSSLQHTSCPFLKYDPVNGFYGHTAAYASTTMYKRSVQITEVDPGEEVTITVTVTWAHGSTNRDFRIRENLFNWQ